MEFSIITISTFVTLLVSVTRYIGTACFKKDISKVLPIFAIIYGVILAVAGFYTTDVEMGKNLIEAIFLGVSTGAAATGINQVGKQLNKDSGYIDLEAFREAMNIDVQIPATMDETKDEENVNEEA